MLYRIFFTSFFCLLMLSSQSQIVDTPKKHIEEERDEIYETVEVEEAPRKLAKGVFEENHKYGLKINNKIVLPPIYDWIYIPYKSKTGNYFIRKDNKRGIVDKDGRLIIPCQYYNLSTIDKKPNWFIVMTKQSQYGVIDNKNNIILPITYSNVQAKNYGLRISKDTLVGLLGYSGQILLETKYDEIYSMNKEEKNLLIMKDNIYSIFVLNQGFIYEENIEKVYFLYSSQTRYFVLYKSMMKTFNNIHILAIEDTNHQFGVYDIDNSKTLIPLKYQLIKERYQDTYIVKQNNKYGVIDKHESILIPFIYDSLNFQNIDLSDDLNTIVALKNGKYGLIDFKGKPLTDFNYSKIEAIKNNCYRGKLGVNSYQVIKSNGQLLTQDTFVYTGTFELNKLPVFDNNGFTYLDTNGIKESNNILPHIGYESLTTLKNDFINCLKSKDDSLLWKFTKKISPSNYTLEYLTTIGVRIGSFPRYLTSPVYMTTQEVQTTYFNNLKSFRDHFMTDTSVSITFTVERNHKTDYRDKERKTRNYTVLDLVFEIEGTQTKITLDKVFFLEGNWIIFSSHIDEMIRNKKRQRKNWR